MLKNCQSNASKLPPRVWSLGQRMVRSQYKRQFRPWTLFPPAARQWSCARTSKKQGFQSHFFSASFSSANSSCTAFSSAATWARCAWTSSIWPRSSFFASVSCKQSTNKGDACASSDNVIPKALASQSISWWYASTTPFVWHYFL